MRSYYELLQNLKSIIEDGDHDATITTDGYPHLDYWKRSVFPIIDINVLSSTFPNLDNLSVTRFDVEVVVLDVRDIVKEDVKDKFWHHDNRHDIWNETLWILKMALAKVRKEENDWNLQVMTIGQADMLENVGTNGLDGWRQIWTIDVNDDWTTVC